MTVKDIATLLRDEWYTHKDWLEAEWSVHGKKFLDTKVLSKIISGELHPAGRFLLGNE